VTTYPQRGTAIAEARLAVAIRASAGQRYARIGTDCDTAFRPPPLCPAREVHRRSTAGIRQVRQKCEDRTAMGPGREWVPRARPLRPASAKSLSDVVPRPDDAPTDAFPSRLAAGFSWAMRGPGRGSSMIFQRAQDTRHDSPSDRRRRRQSVPRAACPAWALSAICPCTAGNSRTPLDTAGLHRHQSNSPRVRETPGHGLFP
jgi:hypothetical protein